MINASSLRFCFLNTTFSSILSLGILPFLSFSSIRREASTLIFHQKMNDDSTHPTEHLLSITNTQELPKCNAPSRESFKVEQNISQTSESAAVRLGQVVCVRFCLRGMQGTPYWHTLGSANLSIHSYCCFSNSATQRDTME